MQGVAPPNLSPEALALQARFMSQPELLNHFYQAYNENKLPPNQLSAFEQLLQAASHQQKSNAAATGQQAGQPQQQLHGMQQQLGGLPPQQQQQQQQQHQQYGHQLGLQPNQQPLPSPQPPFLGNAQQTNVGPTPQQLQSVQPRELAELRDSSAKVKALEAYLGRTDVPPDKRVQAENELVKMRQALKVTQQRIVSIMQANGGNPQAVADLQAQQARLMSQRVLAVQQQQQQQQQQPQQGRSGANASPSLGPQPLPPAHANLARARSPNSLPGAHAPTPPPQGAGGPQRSLQQQASSQGASAKSAQPPSRPGSVAPSQASSSGAFNPVVQGPTAIADDISSRITASRPEAFPNARPTLSQGFAAQPSVSTPAITRPPASMPPTQAPSAATQADKADLSRVVPRKTLRDIVSSVDPGTAMDEEVEDLLLEIADEFIESVTKHSCALAVHRKSDRLEVKDVQLHLDRVWGIAVPGFGSDDVRQSQARRLNPPSTQLARAAAVREAARRRA